MFTENCVVKCVGYNQIWEKFFTIGEIYEVKNNSITNDDGFIYRKYVGAQNIIDWLSDYYAFELVEASPEICSICGEVITNFENAVKINGRYICETCEDENVSICKCCGRAVLNENTHCINDEIVCNRCFSRHYTLCPECGEIVSRDNLRYTNRGCVCENCALDHYSPCYHCDSLIHEDDLIFNDDDNNYYCGSCWNDLFNTFIHGYYFKPESKFYPNYDGNALFMGVELEVDGAGECEENAKTLLDIANANREHIYCKHDGSLNDGFEIVSHPATLDYHTNNINWCEVMETASDMGYKSHSARTCGLHVHVSRSALGDTFDERESTISKILYFIERNWDEILIFTRRTEEQLEEWANRYGIKENIAKTYEYAKGDRDRYHCLNLCNDNTIEFRMFRGTLRHETFIATLQFVNLVCEICKTADNETVENLNWNRFVKLIPAEKYPELIEYLEIRHLNVENV